MFTVLATGDRNWHDATLLWNALAQAFSGRTAPLYLIEGGAKGADSLARAWAETHAVEVHTVEADWPRYHKAAGPIRNSAMLDLKPDLVLAFHDHLALSKGTRNCVQQAMHRGIPVTHYSHLHPTGRNLPL